jgi:hypothetical protein
MLVIHAAFNLTDILLGDPKGQLRAYKLLSGATPCELVSDFMSTDSVQPHSVPGRYALITLMITIMWLI